jgi:hypothetical protein
VETVTFLVYAIYKGKMEKLLFLLVAGRGAFRGCDGIA